MNPNYEIGQKVRIRLNNNQATSLRGGALEQYLGQIGQISEYYSISPRLNQIFYIYTVLFGSDKRIILYEDEIEKSFE